VVWGFLRGPYPTLLSRAVVGGVFLLAGIGKALDTHRFAAEISAYQLMPAALVQPLAVALPLIEILLAAYLLIGLAQRWAAAATGVLLLVFIGAMAWALVHGLTLDCGCFGNALGVGVLRETVSAGSIARDVLWLALCVHLMIVPSIWSIDAFRRKRTRKVLCQETSS
jgi:uncharacterized membrane protein YphA (DoxX/SURF4 family)